MREACAAGIDFWVISRVLMFQDSRENKTYCFPRDNTSSVYVVVSTSCSCSSFSTDVISGTKLKVLEMIFRWHGSKIYEEADIKIEKITLQKMYSN